MFGVNIMTDVSPGEIDANSASWRGGAGASRQRISRGWRAKKARRGIMASFKKKNIALAGCALLLLQTSNSFSLA